MVKYILPLLLLFASTANAQRAVILELPNGQYVGLVYLANGDTVVVPTVTMIKLPGPDPTPPPDTSGDVTTVVIRIASKLTVEQSTTLLEVHDWADQQTGVQVIEFAPDAENADGTPNATAKSYYDKIPVGGKYPYGFVAQKTATGKGHILWQGEITTSAAIIQQIKAAMTARESGQSNKLIPYTEKRGNR